MHAARSLCENGDDKIANCNKFTYTTNKAISGKYILTGKEKEEDNTMIVTSIS